MSENRTLPDGWRWERLGDLCLMNPRRPELRRSADTPTTFVPMPSVAENGKGIARPEIKRFEEVRKGYTYFENGDVIFAKITPCMQNGKHAIARNLLDGIAFGSTEFHVLRPKENMTAEWLHYFLIQPRILQLATEHFTGAVGQQRVPDSYLAELILPVPPLAEQKHLVALLSDQMAIIDRARAAAEAQLQAVNQLPAALLSQAFRGLI